MNAYLELKNRQQKEVNDFPMFFAFNDKQFAEGMKKFGLKPTETNKIYKFGNTGGFYLKTDAKALRDMMDRHVMEMDEAIKNDKDGTGFIYQMFMYELANHEYCITYDIEPTLYELGLTKSDILKNPALEAGLAKAKVDYINSCY